VSGTRADYGLMRRTLAAIKKTPGLSLTVAATGMHLMKEFGRTVSEIRADGFNVREISCRYAGDDRNHMALFAGEFAHRMAKELSNRKPDTILLLGDRAEMLASAMAGLYCGILTVHIHGGEVTSTVDDAARHAITKLAHAHFCATRRSAQMILSMGEESKRVFVTGAPGLDEIASGKRASIKYLSSKYGFDAAKPLILAVQHPVSSQIMLAAGHMLTTLSAIKKTGMRAIVIYPNADAGGRSMIKVIKDFTTGSRFITAYPSIPHGDFLELMKCASVMVGNSSAGIVEAPSLGLPVVNVGERQRGRERGSNVIDCGHDKKSIEISLMKALGDKQFRTRAAKGINPYGDGRTARIIAGLLKKLPTRGSFLQKISAC
jgi:UDP-hydrolysing UDP-N-acetyl-D-glucosamine 2-epimerase